MSAERAVVIHGHFYQPPRENPWTGEVERQPSAGEDHDWNARIARQCYIPNGRARIGDGPYARVVNNYAFLSFNFGPTLLSWYERAHPEEYARLLEADRESLARLGRGNAIAQGYSHMILPLASARDRRTQVLWGLADFRRRFGREAEALWLPETAASDAVLGELARHGLRYAILAPSQARRWRRPGGEWESGEVDPRRPYLWKDPAGGPGLALFFYHGPLSRAVAFERLMADSRSAARRLEEAAGVHRPGPVPHEEPRLVSLATDGETYGHHEVFADLGLAHLAAEELPARGLGPVNFSWWLDRHPPRWEAELEHGPRGLGTAWSCAHGLGRWTEDCGCGSEGGGRQAWRRPLRAALDELREELDAHFEAAGARLLEDPWEARDAYGEVLASPRAASGFWRARRRRWLSSWEKARALLEMQKFAMFMYTSCGWFFSDVAGIEAVQNLKYAARAVELCRESGGPDLEPELLRGLEEAPANDPRFKDAAAVWAGLVRG